MRMLATLTILFTFGFSFASVQEPDQISMSEYFKATNMAPNIEKYIDLVLNDLSQTEKQDLKDFLKAKNVDIKKKMPEIAIGKNEITIGGKKLAFNYKDLSLKINGWNFAFDEKDSPVKSIEKMTKYFDNAVGSHWLFNRAYAEESATSYFAHGLEISAASAIGSYAFLKVASVAKNGMNVVNWDTGAGFIPVALSAAGVAVGYVGVVASGALWGGQTLALHLTNDKASVVCENNKVMIKIDGKLITPDQLKTDSPNGDQVLKYLAKTYTCTKTMTEKVMMKVVNAARGVSSVQKSSTSPSSSGSSKDGAR